MLSRRPVLLLALAFGFCLAPSARAADPISIEGDPGGPLRGSAPKNITLQLSAEAARTLRKLPDKAADGPAVRLSIQGVKAPAGASIRVFLNFPDAPASTTVNDPHYVGSITSFEDPAPDAAGDDVLLDAAPALRYLKKSERVLAGDTLAVTLVVAEGSAPADVSIPVEKVVLSIVSQGR
jgi:hypothetical protein